MEAPKCRICQGRHYGLCPTSGKGADGKDPPLGDKQQTVTVPKEAAAIAGVSPKHHGKAPFDRVKYQRDYMAKRRAATRATRHKA